MTPGTLLVYDNFRFSDGTTGKKILVILNDGSVGYYIVVKTTSKNTHKSSNEGCQTQERYPNLVVSTSVRAPNLLKKSEKIGSLIFFYIVSFEQIKIIKINKTLITPKSVIMRKFLSKRRMGRASLHPS